MSRVVVLTAWGVVAAMVVGCEMASMLSRRRLAGMGDVLSRLSGSTWSLLAMLVGWMWVGWHFFAR